MGAAAELPLVPVSRKRPRLQWVDTGLLNAASNLQSASYANPDLQDIHRGIVAEHIVGQQLLALEPQRLAKPNFWVREKRQSTAKVDFIIVVDGQIISIEVKSGVFCRCGGSWMAPSRTWLFACRRRGRSSKSKRQLKERPNASSLFRTFLLDKLRLMSGIRPEKAAQF